MLNRLIRAMGATFVVLAALVAAPAQANTKTVNGISAETNFPQIQRGIPYSHQLTATGPGAFVGPYTFTHLSGTLPAGITISSSGLVSGTTCDPNGSYSGIGMNITSQQATPVTAAFTGGNSMSVNVTTSPGGSCAVTVGGTPGAGVVGTAYAGAVTATGGTTPYAYSVTSGALPPGLVLNPATGAITGTPTAAGTYSFSIYVVDASLRTGVGTYSITVTATPAVTLTVSPATLPNGTTTVAYSQAITASAGTAPYTYSLQGGTLPTGLALSTAGVLSGTPTVAGSYTFTVRAQDNASNSGTQSYTVTIAGSSTLTVNPATLPGGVNGTAYSQTFTAGGGTAPYTFALNTGALPTGLSLAANGALTGTPTVAGSYTFNIRAQDANGNFGTRTYTVTIAGTNSLTVNPATLPNGSVAVAYSQAVTGAGGTAPYSFTVISGALPPGLSLSGAGAITGTPTAAGTYNVGIRAFDANGNFGTTLYSVTIASASIPVVSPTTLPNGTNGAAYSQPITASNGVAPYQYYFNGGTSPPGLTIANDGTLSGVPTTAGTYTFTISAQDAVGTIGSQTYTVTIAGANTLTISPATLPDATNGSAYSEALSAFGGFGPFTFSLDSGALPAGMTLSAAGAITGTPSVAGTYAFVVRVVQPNGNFGTHAYTLFVTGANSLSITPTSLPGATNGASYSQALSANGGTGPYTYSLDSGSLPAGLSLSAAGAITGTPTAAGSYAFTVEAIDANGNFGSQSYTVVVAGANSLTVTPSSIPGATNGTAYNESFSATGGTGPYTYTSTGTLPTGLSLSSTGDLTGTPTVAGSYTFTIEVMDANGNFGSQSYTIVVAGANSLTVTPASIPSATNGTAYNESFSATGGTGPYTYTSTGTLPTGLSLSSTGDLTGTPTVAGSYTFTIEVMDANGNFGSQSYTIVVAGANALSITPASLPGATNGSAYNEALTASGGTGPYTFSLDSGSLPNGVSMSSAGAITGTPTVAGSYSFTVEVMDANGNFGSQSYTIVVAGANALSITPASLPGATNGTAYGESLTASGGTGPYTFSLDSGALPTGMSLSAAGAITGTPTVAGAYTFTIDAIDANGNFGSRSYTVVVAGANSLAVTPASLPGGTNGTAYTQTISATGGTGPYTYASTGTLPTGLSLSPNGDLSGTPTVAGSYTFTIDVIDANGNFGAQSYTVAIAGAHVLTMTPATLPGGTNGVPYTQTITAAGGTGGYTFVVDAGTAPAGFALANTGTLSGTPTTAGAYTFTVRATDANGDYCVKTYTVLVAGAASLTMTPTTLPAATNNAAYAQAITATGGNGAYTFSLDSGTLPAGLSLAANGALAGTTSVAGTYDFTVGVIDGNGNTGVQAYSLVVGGAQTLTIHPGTLPGGNVGAAYTLPFTGTGGTSITFNLASGSVPPGLTLAANGTLAGTPTTTGTYTFTVRGQDANGNFGTRTVSLAIDVSLRADPTRNRGVTEGIDGQVDAARRAGELQMGHVFRRLESATGCTVRDAANDDDACDQRVQAWATGTREQQFGSDGQSRLGAFTLGGDVAVGAGRFGVALGTGWDEAARISGVRTDADSRTLMLYGRMPLQSALAIDVVAGRSDLDVDARRFNGATGTRGDRDGETTFAGVGLAGQWQSGDFAFAPYARYEVARTRLDGYAETGPADMALQYGALRTRTTAFVLGADLGYGLRFDWGTLTPRLRVEMRERNGDDVNQALWYVDRPGTQYLVSRAGVDSRAALATFGIEAAFRGVTLTLEYGSAGAALDDFDGETLRFGVKAGF